MCSREEKKRAPVHEAGHLIVALHYGINVVELNYTNRKPSIVSDLTNADRQHVGTFLAAGAAAEEFHLKTPYDVIFRKENVPGTFEEYIPKAQVVIESHLDRFKKLIYKITVETTKNEWDAGVADEAEKTIILSLDQIMQVWNT